MKESESVKTTTHELGNFSRKEILKACLTTAVKNGLPVVIWSLPNSEELQLIIAFDQAQPVEKVDLEELGSGFIISPFDQKKSSPLYIPRDLLISFQYEEIRTNFDFSKSEKEDKEAPLVLQIFDELDKGKSRTSFHQVANKLEAPLPDYRTFVENCIQVIQKGRVQKVVPARYKEIELNEEFNPVDQLLALGDAYPNAFTSLCSIPSVGTWMGATPELLIAQQGDHFKTVALAATQKRDPEKPASDTAWTQKEIEEQAMVSRYIVNCFKKIRLREFEEKGPKTTVAGNLLHLKTDYSVNMAETNFPELGTVMLELLHPTSAIAGMPKDEALELIAKWEGFDREFFSGFLGPVNINNHSHIFVNLRCMQLFENKARLYAGAGVTEDSDPEKEFQETEIKFNTLLNIIQPKK